MKASPDDNELAVYRGGTLVRLAELQSHLPAGLPSAIATAREAVAALRRAGEVSDAGREAASALIVLGDLLFAADDVNAAAGEWEASRSKLEGLVVAHPKVPGFVIDLARAELRLARVAALKGQKKPSDSLLRAARRHLDAARAAAPTTPASPRPIRSWRRGPSTLTRDGIVSTRRRPAVIVESHDGRSGNLRPGELPNACPLICRRVAVSRLGIVRSLGGRSEAVVR